MSKKTSKALVKAQHAKKVKGKLMLAPSFLKARQVLHLLQRTPEGHIYKRKGKGNQEFEYVTGTYMKKVLNYAFGWMWDFKVLEHGREKDMIWVLGELTVKDMKGHSITKTQFGRADVKYYKDKSKGMLDFGNDLKSATTDALKKCAAELGIASDVYGKQEFKDIRLNIDKEFTEPANGEGEKIKKVKGILAGPREFAMIESYCRKLGKDDPDRAYDFIKKLTGMELNEKLTKNDAMTIIGKLLEKLTAGKNGKKN